MLAQFIVQGEDQTLHVPYGTGNSGHGSDGRNNGFINLHTNPERMDEIHELRGYPELRECLETMLKASVFRSLRADTVMDEHIIPHYRSSCYSMFTMVFLNATPSDGEDYRYFFEDFKKSAKESKISDRVIAYFVENPVKAFNVGSTFEGVCLDIRIIGLGYSQADARGQWKVGMRCLKKCLDRWQGTDV